MCGRERRAYAAQHAALVEQLGQLEALERRIAECDCAERSTRGADALQQALVEYCEALIRVIAGLAGMCGHLARDEAGYRAAESARQSRFNRDKAGYDLALSELERTGRRLNRMFSTY